MRKIILIITITFQSLNVFSQCCWEIDFENWYYGENRIFIDTISNPNNIWQVGQPNKIIFNEAYSQPNAIVTDTLNYYPINDTSSFIIKHRREFGQHGHTILLAFKYKLNSDTIVDYGKIETSFDYGETWVDLLDDEDINFYNIYWWYDKPVLSGNIEEWQDVHVDLAGIDYHFDYNDTILYKFTFTSDNVDNQKEGWLIDNILLDDWYENIEYINPDFNSIVFPNPITEYSILKFDNERQENYIIEIFLSNGKLINTIQTKSSKIEISKTEYIKGLYFYRIYDEKSYSCGKFIIN